MYVMTEGPTLSKSEMTLAICRRHGVQLDIETKDNSKVVRLRCPIWVNKDQYLPTTYSNEFTDQEILADIMHKMAIKCGQSITRTDPGFY